MNNKIYITILTAFLLIFSACEELLDPEPVGQDVVDNFYNDSEGAVAAINAAYAALGESNGNRAASVYYEPIWTMMDMSTDDAQGSFETNSFTFGPGLEDLIYYWEGSYRGIYRANVVLNRIDAVPFEPENENLRDRIRGEAYFLRGLNYYNLVIAFGDVPLIENEIQSLDEVDVARSPQEEVFALIESDLQEAIQLLPLQYDGGQVGEEKGRATKGAARAVLAKMHLWLGDYSSALPYLEDIVNSGVYDLQESYLDNFQGRTENGIESVFEVQHASQAIPAYSDNYWIPRAVHQSGQQRCWPTDENPPPEQNGPIEGFGLIQAFEPNDERDTVLTNLGLLFREADSIPLRNMSTKYLVYDVQGRNSSMNTPVIRYADVLLLYAEAINETNGGPNTTAFDAINQVRNRAGLEDLNGLNQSEFREAVRHERRVELFLECGHRWYDLRRWGIFLERVRAQRGVGAEEIPDFYRVFPIPQLAINRNAKLTQNEGY